jgi:rhamnogalacturonyl hydrolase YesR
MTELMRELDPSNPDYAKIRAGYEKMMAGLLSYQIASGEGAGLWKQVIDDTTAQNWAETSGSAMFAYAMVAGVRNGWLDPAVYGPPARKAWLGLVGKLQPDGQLKDVSDWMWDGTGDDGPYLQRTRVTGDNHGQAPMMWTAAALIR